MQQSIQCRVRMPYFGVTDWGTLAEVAGDYGVHARYGYAPGYTVTQVSTGLVVCHRPTRKEALAAMEASDD